MVGDVRSLLNFTHTQLLIETSSFICAWKFATEAKVAAIMASSSRTNDKKIITAAATPTINYSNNTGKMPSKTNTNAKGSTVKHAIIYYEWLCGVRACMRYACSPTTCGHLALSANRMRVSKIRIIIGKYIETIIAGRYILVAAYFSLESVRALCPCHIRIRVYEYSEYSLE